MHDIIFKPFPVKYGTINWKDHIPSNSHPAEIRDILLGNSFPIYFGKKKITIASLFILLYKGFVLKSKLFRNVTKEVHLLSNSSLPAAHWYCSTFVHPGMSLDRIQSSCSRFPQSHATPLY